MKSSTLLRKLNPKDLVLIFQSWRLLLVGAMLGAVISGLVLSVTPPNYRAEAIVSIDLNLEQAWPFPMDKSEFIFIGRETNKLVLVAWSDEVLKRITEIYPEYTKTSLKESVLYLDNSSEGGWKFHTNTKNKNKSIAIVNLWTSAFINELSNRINTSFEIESARFILSEKIANSPDISYLVIEHEIKIIDELLTGYAGISPYVEFGLIQSGEINSFYNMPKSVYLLVGSIIGVFSTLILTIIFTTPSNKNDKE